MQSSKIIFLLVVLTGLSGSLAAQLLPNLGGQRAGVSALTFLKSDVNPRSVGLSGASVALPADGYAVFNNPAAISLNRQLNISTSNLSFGAGLHQSFLSTIVPRKNNPSAFAFSINTLNSGPMEVRTEFQPGGTGQQFYATSLATGVSYSQSLSDKFSMGLTLKYIYEQLDQYTNHTGAFDFGFLYTTDVRDLRFAVLVQNFGGNSSINGDFLEVDFNRDPNDVQVDNYTVPTTFKLGMSFVPWKRDHQSLLASAQLDHPNDNSENLRFGLEYEYLKLLFLRAGYKINVQGQNLPSFGLGYRAQVGAHPLRINYSINPTQYLGIQHSFGFSFTFNKTNRDRDESE